MPAREIIPFSALYIYHGILPSSVCCHSKKPLTGIMHRFDRNDEEKEGFVSILSDLALKVLYLMISAWSRLLVQEGINPHFNALIFEGSLEQIAGNEGNPNAW
jgi:hypothetical protein